MRAIIVGNGEVGKSLYEVLKDHHEIAIRGIEEVKLPETEILNICFPYVNAREFKKYVRRYQKMYRPLVTIIHSTVPVGTCRKLKAVHSPIHGKHPHLAEGIRTFVKYVGGGDPLAVKFLKDAGIKTKVVGLEESELSKILCTTNYGWQIIFMKEVKRICDELKLNFDEVYGWNKYYNEGYEALGMGQFHRPVLAYTEGKIGGHCVIPNCKFLYDANDPMRGEPKIVQSFVAREILYRNDKY